MIFIRTFCVVYAQADCPFISFVNVRNFYAALTPCALRTDRTDQNSLAQRTVHTQCTSLITQTIVRDETKTSRKGLFCAPLCTFNWPVNAHS